MSNATSHTPLGDPKHDQALFRFPREIRDEIYRLLVKGCYLACEEKNVDQAGLSVLRVSKSIGAEAMEILYSESVFRFFIDHDHKDMDREHLQRVVPRMRYVHLHLDGMLFDSADWFQTWGDKAPTKRLEKQISAFIGLFEHVDINRQSLHVRITRCSAYLLWETSLFCTFCQGLKGLVVFRVANVEVILSSDFLWKPQYTHYHGFDITQKIKYARDLVGRVTHAVTKELGPEFGPPISGFKSDIGNVPMPKGENLFCLGDTGLIGFLQFHPSEHLVKTSATEKDALQ
ncbi:hypothetical protein IMSHALPRED_009392 [Imshaugia aleurites]|uniref:Uncharacterized protein n=1 Tax=Imshaugia aleurites TaxID=172621 RepID=A0A8H3FZ39_9LECA|nr:hypothetical protein IMSHALPRED_009392 [Imshaugia aleurites]